ncbi:MAG: alcohol dehydrogenase catalytic domain-containing protein, partial [Candidatus Atribacteria bacterium]|nr:alcohol dehydrogenase catalytic domain-containing protein [Candidatus Atribacteria bacterium]
AVLYGKKNIKIEEVNLPPSQGSIMIKVAACGICISDVKAYQEGQSHYCKPPVILGHEYVGNIVTTPKENNNFKKGDRVAVIHAVNCGYCSYCQRGLFELCENKQRASNGGFAEYVSINEKFAKIAFIKIPAKLSTNEVTFLEPIACCIEALERCNIRLGDIIVIIGAGVMGLLLLQLSLLKGASKVIVSEINEYRRNIAKNFGAIVINPKEANLKKFIMKETDFKGSDVVISTVFKESIIQESFSFTRKQGTVFIFGSATSNSKLELDSDKIHYDQIKIIGTSAYKPFHFNIALKLLKENRISVTPLITSVEPLKNIIRALDNYIKPENLKIIIRM